MNSVYAPISIYPSTRSSLFISSSEVEAWFAFWHDALYKTLGVRDYQWNTLPIFFGSGYVTEADLQMCESLYLMLAHCGWETELSTSGSLHKLEPGPDKVLTYEDELIVAMIAKFMHRPGHLVVTSYNPPTDHIWLFEGEGEGSYTYERVVRDA